MILAEQRKLQAAHAMICGGRPSLPDQPRRNPHVFCPPNRGASCQQPLELHSSSFPPQTSETQEGLGRLRQCFTQSLYEAVQLPAAATLKLSCAIPWADQSDDARTSTADAAKVSFMMVVPLGHDSCRGASGAPVAKSLRERAWIRRQSSINPRPKNRKCPVFFNWLMRVQARARPGRP